VAWWATTSAALANAQPIGTSCVLKKPPKRGGYPKKQDASRFSRMRPKTPPAKVNDACVLKKPPKRGGYPKKTARQQLLMNAS